MTDGMRKGRTTGGAILAGLMVLLVPSVGHAAALALPPDAGAPGGRTVAVALAASDAAGIVSADVRIEFDPAVVQTVAVATTLDTAGFVLTANTDTPGVVLISMFGTAALGSSAELLRIDLLVLGTLGDSTPLDLVSAELNEGGIAAVLADGLFTVLPTYRLQQATASVGGAASASLSFSLGSSAGQELAIGAASNPAHVLQSGFWGFAGSGVVPVVVTAGPAGFSWSGNNPPYSIYRSTACGDVLSSLLTTASGGSYSDPESPSSRQVFCYQVVPSPPGS